MSAETETVQVQIDSDEWYPVFSAEIAGTSCFNYGVTIAVPKAKFEEWAKVMESFRQMQRELEELSKAAVRENKG